MMTKLALNRIIAILLIPVILNSCTLYRIKKTNLSRTTSEETIQEKKFSYIVLHSGNSFWRFNSPTISDSTFSGTLSKLDDKAYNLYYKALQSRNMIVRHNNRDVGQQLHFFVDEFTQKNGRAQININQIKEIQILDVNKGATALTNLGGLVGGLVGGISIFLAIACNCPHNYVYDGEKYIFTNTLFTGATAPNLERNDFKFLPDLRPNSNTYEMYIKNEENEVQYTNLLELIVVNHRSGIEVYQNQEGKLFSISDLKEPSKIIGDLGQNLKNISSYNDDNGYLFDATSTDEFSNLYASFDKPKDVSNAKIILKARNSKWGGMVYKEFSQLFGKKHDEWVKKNRKRSFEEANKELRAAGIPLTVSIKKDGEWIDVDYIDLIGEVSYNTLVVPIDATLLTDPEIEVRLRSGFMFWDLDYVGMDFSQPEKLDIQSIKPTIANGAKDFINDLAKDDNLYMDHTQKGDSTYIKFEGLLPATESRSIFLHSKGYYMSLDTYEGKPEWMALYELNTVGGFSKFSRELFQEYSNSITLQLKQK